MLKSNVSIMRSNHQIPLPALLFRFFCLSSKDTKWPSFDDELVTSFESSFAHFNPRASKGESVWNDPLQS
jgi:hypothetical protein